MSYLLWLILLGGAFVWTLKRPQEDNEDNNEDLSEWTYPSCGFHVQWVRSVFAAVNKSQLADLNRKRTFCDPRKLVFSHS